MTIEEMRNRIEEECRKYNFCSNGCKLYETFGYCPFDYCPDDRIADNNTVEEMYDIMFGKEETEMKKEFDFNDLQAGMAIKTLNRNDLFIGVQMKDDIVFFNKDYTPIIDKHDIIYKKHNKNYEVIEVYGFSNDNFNLFDESKRELIWVKEEDMNFKKYRIGNLNIMPNCDKGCGTCKISGYKTEKEDFLFIRNEENSDQYLCIEKSELKGVIDALTEIYEFIEENE